MNEGFCFKNNLGNTWMILKINNDKITLLTCIDGDPHWVGCVEYDYNLPIKSLQHLIKGGTYTEVAAEDVRKFKLELL